MLQMIQEYYSMPLLYSGIHIKTNISLINLTNLRLRLLGYNNPNSILFVI